MKETLIREKRHYTSSFTWNSKLRRLKRRESQLSLESALMSMFKLRGRPRARILAYFTTLWSPPPHHHSASEVCFLNCSFSAGKSQHYFLGLKSQYYHDCVTPNKRSWIEKTTTRYKPRTERDTQNRDQNNTQPNSQAGLYQDRGRGAAPRGASHVSSLGNTAHLVGNGGTQRLQRRLCLVIRPALCATRWVRVLD